MLWLLGAACCFMHLKVHCPVDKCPIWALVLNSQSQRTDELSTIERGSSSMKSPSFCDWNCLSPSILLSWPNIRQTQSFQRQVLLVCDNMWQSVTICDNLWQSVTICDNQWQSVTICDNLWQSVTISDNLWQSVTICDNTQVVGYQAQLTLNLHWKAAFWTDWFI